MLQLMGLLFNLLCDKPVKTAHNDKMDLNRQTLTRVCKFKGMHLNARKWCNFFDNDYLFLLILKGT